MGFDGQENIGGERMSLTCTCSHLRKEHDGGKKAINDRRIGVCNHDGCNCKEYWADQKSRKVKDQILISACVIPLIIVICCVIGFFISWVAIDFMLEDYNITSEFEYKKLQDGVEIENDLVIKEPKERMSFMMKELVAMIFIGVAMFASVFSGMAYYENKLNELIKGDMS